ncbi:PREDICTED: caldesmon [Sturnus vulgaris]|uniref:caldesmon n=1 Tax=Sturnus vulgaris TaxID=9172 RepID=UPI000719F4D3|nr:PREDICTED: caldesmon [Sturnus vulgaris]
MDDFERRRELRRQKREEMRLEAERLSYQRNDDDDEEAARERRRRARQERLRQKEEGDLSGEGTEKSEVNAQNSVAGEESKRSTDDEAALLERLARREERRQKRLQEALERQKELDPTITDGSLSVPSRREVNNVEENETTGKEDKAEKRRGRYEIEETETKSYQKNNWRQDGEEEEKKEEKDKEEVQEEKPKELPVEENQVEVTAEKPTDKEEAVTINAEEHKAENDTNAVPEGTQSVTDAVDKEKLQDEEKAEEERKEAEERERLKAEEEKRAAEEKQRAEEEKRAAEEKQRAEEEKRAAEEKQKAEEEKRAAEERAKAEEERKAAEERERAKAEEERRAAEEKQKAEEEKRAAEEKAKLEAEKLKEKQKMEEQKMEDKQVKEKKVEDEKPQAAFLKKQEEEKVEAKKEKLAEEKLQATSIKDQVKDDKGKAPKEEMKSVWDRKKGVPEQKAQNGEREFPASKLKPTENAFGRSSLKGSSEEAKPGVEALKRLEDQRRRRGENESEELEKLKEKQQEAAAELDELKKRREERRKILEEEEQKKKQEEAERKIREEEEKRRMKEEIERRRAEAAEKRQKMPEDGVSEDKKPFKCFSPKGSSLKIEERTEFLNKSAQKSGMKPTQTTAVVSKIDSRLEQYTSAIEGTKASRPAKASDLHVPAEGVRNIKSMWEKGNVFSSPSGTGTPNKETAGLKVGVSSRINEWLTKTPESNKSPAPKPSDLRPGDVSGKRNLWEKQSVEKPAASSKVSAMGKKSETNGLRQIEKEP